MNKNNYQKISSLALAAAIQLASSKSKLQSIEFPHNSKQAVFVFNDSEELEGLIDHFWKKSLPLDAFSYYESLRFIKARLYSEKI